MSYKFFLTLVVKPKLIQKKIPENIFNKQFLALKNIKRIFSGI